METVGDYLTRDRRSDRPALVDSDDRVYDAHWLCTSAWKAGNFLRHTGVRRGVTVGIAGTGPFALLSFLGTALLEGRTWFDPPTTLDTTEEVRTLVAPAARLDRYDVEPPIQRVCYDGEPPTPDVHHLDAGLWSENPSFPPIDLDPATPLLADPAGVASEGTITHGEAMTRAQVLVDRFDVDAGSRVVVREPFDDPRTVVAGILVPLVAAGVTVLAADESDDGSSVDGDVYVVASDAESTPGTCLPLSAVDVADS